MLALVALGLFAYSITGGGTNRQSFDTYSSTYVPQASSSGHGTTMYVVGTTDTLATHHGNLWVGACFWGAAAIVTGVTFWLVRRPRSRSAT
jgi:uncharacterized membrane protein